MRLDKFLGGMEVDKQCAYCILILKKQKQLCVNENT